MLFEAVSCFWHQHSYLLLPLLIYVLGFSTGLLRAPFTPTVPPEEENEEPIERLAALTGQYLGSPAARMERGRKVDEALKDHQGIDATQRENLQGVQAMQRESTQASKQEGGAQGAGLKQRNLQESSPRPSWLRSLSRRRSNSNLNEQDSNPGLQREASLTGEEVKVLADAFIARVRQRMRVQRQESLKLRPQVSYKAPPLP